MQIPDEVVLAAVASLSGAVVAMGKIIWDRSKKTEEELHLTRSELQEVREEVVDIKASREGFLKGVEKISSEVISEVRSLNETPVSGDARVVKERQK